MFKTAKLYFPGILIIYGLLSLYQLNLPGLHYDEAFEAVPALQLLLGQPVMAFRNSSLILGHQVFPLMTQDYIGAINTYAAIPFIAILGSTPTALRVMSVLVGAITLWLTYALSRSLTGSRRVGLSAALLLAVDPTFIFWNRQGVFVTAVTAAIGLAASLCWLRRWQSGSKRWTMAGAFFFGLGLYAKLLFLWLIAALTGALILLELPRLVKQKTGLRQFWPLQKVEIFAAIPAFLLGCWPLIVYNIQTRGTFLSVAQNAQTSYYGINNLAFGPNLLERLSQFTVILDGSHLWYLGAVIRNPLPPLAFGLVLVLLVLVASMTTRNRLIGAPQPLSTTPPILGTPVKIALFPFLVVGLVILASIGTVSALWITHFALLMPWPAMAMATGTWFILSQGIPPRFTPLARWGHLLTWVGLGLLVLTNLWSVSRYHQSLTESGGLSSHSDAVYDMSHWLAEQAAGPVVAMDWGLAAPVIYLTHGQITPVEVFGYAWQPDLFLTDRLEKFIRQPTTLYLWHAPDEIIFDRSQVFKTLYRPLYLEETIEAAFYERSGRPLLGVTRLVACGTPGINPPEPSEHCP